VNKRNALLLCICTPLREQYLRFPGADHAKRRRVQHQGHVSTLAAGTKSSDGGQHIRVLAGKDCLVPGLLPAELGGLVERGELAPGSVVRLIGHTVASPVDDPLAGLAPHAAARCTAVLPGLASRSLRAGTSGSQTCRFCGF